MYTTFPAELRLQRCSPPSTSPNSTRACEPCRAAKIRCSRQLPSCQACVRRGKGAFCSYRANVAPCEPGRIAKQRCSIASHTCKGFLGGEPQKTRVHKTSRRSSQNPSFALASTNRKEQASASESLDKSGLVGTSSPGKSTPLIAVNGNQVDGVSGDTRSDGTAYSQMKLSALLPPPLQCPEFNSINTHEEAPPTFHQLLLVLNYIFVIAVLPEDDLTTHCTILRHSTHWERAFIPQYDGLLPWLTSVREALVGPHYLQTVSLDDLESQIRWILFMLGKQALPGSSFLEECFQRGKYPYRPFGERASIALICLAFTGLQPRNIKDYESKDIWPSGEPFYALMASRLGQSPLFEGGVSVAELKNMVLRLHQAFQLEEECVACTMP